MKAVILAAGEGKRLRPFTETMPKVMLPVANKPILEYIIDAAKKSGIDEIIIVVGYKKEVIMDYFKNYEDMKITYVVQNKQLGTAHALLKAKKHIKTLNELKDNEMLDLADILRKVLRKLRELNLSHNFYLHYSPKKENLHFHIEVAPRIATWAGFEFSSGITINSVMPEEAAKFYRS